jgi:alginate O-acetyltransferase complex protein AlgJ
MKPATDTHIQVEASDNTGEPTRSPYLFFRKLFLFLLIPVVLYEVWIIATPLNLYTFRSWEALTSRYPIFAGQFYPNQNLTMTEAGELGVRTEFSIPKTVTFITDEYGYRFDSSTAQTQQYDGVIIGDSMAAGSGLTQTDTLASVLSAELQGTIYPLAPASINTLLRDTRFGTALPPLVILQVIERNITEEVCPTHLMLNPRTNYFMETNPALVQTRVIFDRSIREKNYLTNYLTARWHERTVIVSDSGMLFYELSLASPAVETVPTIVTALSRCQQWFAEQGVVFVFLPIPDRETIYFDNIPDSQRPAGMTYAERSQFLRQLINELQTHGITVADTLTAFEAARDSSMNPYHLDDTHWNADGVRLAVDLLLEILSAN